MLPLWKILKFEAKRATEPDPHQIAATRVTLFGAFEPVEPQHEYLEWPRHDLAPAGDEIEPRADSAPASVEDRGPAVPTDQMPTDEMIDAGARLIYAHAREAQASWPRAVSLAREVWETMDRANGLREE